MSSQFEEQITKIYKEKELYGDFIFAVVNEDGLAYSFAMNRDILEGRESSLDNDSPLYIASHTKSFTATLLKIMEENGELDLNSSLAENLPELNYNDGVDTKTIRLKDLLNHTHGTFSTRFTWKSAFLGYGGENSELISDLNNDFIVDPSRTFRYSNVGPIIASMVVDKTSGSSWKKELEEHVFLPLHMDHTSAYVSDFKFDEIRPSVTASQERGIVEAGFYKKDITMHASGGVISTINDLSSWLKANIEQDENLMSKEGWSALHTSTTTQDKTYFTYQRTGYSFGWDIAEYNDEAILTRFGGLGGISFHISFMPEKNLGIIAFSSDNRASLLPHLMANYAYNVINSSEADSLFKEEEQTFNKSFEAKNKIVYSDEEDLLELNTESESMLGVYENDLGWPTITVEAKADHMILRWGELDGPIYKTEGEEYLGELGVLSREFKIQNDTLLTGSLIYTKIKV